MIRKILGAVGYGIGGIVIFIIASITTFAVPIVVILWIGHLGPFAKPTTSPTTLSFCSTLNTMTNWAQSQPTPTTVSEAETDIGYAITHLARTASVPADIRGTVNASIFTGGKMIHLLLTGTANGGLTTAQQSTIDNLDRTYNQEAGTMKKWYVANC